MHRTATAALLLASALGCATAAPFQAGRPIEVEKKGLGNVYRQDGKPLDLWSTLAGLEAVEGARDDARRPPLGVRRDRRRAGRAILTRGPRRATGARPRDAAPPHPGPLPR
jgi:hypothetical protein